MACSFLISEQHAEISLFPSPLFFWSIGILPWFSPFYKAGFLVVFYVGGWRDTEEPLWGGDGESCFSFFFPFLGLDVRRVPFFPSFPLC